MKQEKLIEIITSLVHGAQTEDTEHGIKVSQNGVLKPVENEIKNVGICLDLTEHVMQLAREMEIDFLIIHHSKGETVKERLAKLDGTGAYGLHLDLDIAEGGLIDRLADAVQLRSREPLALAYKQSVISRGALAGNLGISPGALIERIAMLYSTAFKYMDLEVGMNAHKEKYQKAVVATGNPPGRELMRHAIEQKADVVIVGSLSNEAKKIARDNRISVICIGDYESHFPGLTRFRAEVYDRVDRGCYVALLPNYRHN